MAILAPLRRLVVSAYYRYWPYLHPIRRWEMDVFGRYVHGKVVDAGCGSGAVAYFLGKHADHVEAFDFDAASVEASKRHNGAANIHYAQGNAEAIPFADSSFDTALSISVIGQCDKEKAVNELLRVTKPGGYAVVTSKSANIDQLDLDALARRADITRHYAMHWRITEMVFRRFIDFADWRTLFSFIFYPLYWLDAKLGKGKGRASVLVMRKH